MKGITLLLAVLISSVALSVGAGIFALLFNELEISGTARDAMIAYYAADAGMECALYWDLKDPTPFDPASLTDNTITCNGQAISPVGGPSSLLNNPPTSDFTIALDDQNSISCSRVIVTKDIEDGIPITQIYALGENKVCGAAISSRTVQQGFALQK